MKKEQSAERKMVSGNINDLYVHIVFVDDHSIYIIISLYCLLNICIELIVFYLSLMYDESFCVNIGVFYRSYFIPMYFFIKIQVLFIEN